MLLDFIFVICRVSVVFVEKDGTEKTVQGPIGQDLLHLAHENDVDLEGITLAA